MNKELCFNIENLKLYLEQVLVDYMDIPIFSYVREKINTTLHCVQILMNCIILWQNCLY